MIPDVKATNPLALALACPCSSIRQELSNGHKLKAAGSDGVLKQVSVSSAALAVYINYDGTLLEFFHGLSTCVVCKRVARLGRTGAA